MARGDNQQKKSIHTSANAPSSLNMSGWCFPGSPHQERLCTHQGAPLRSHSQGNRGISARIGTSLSFCFFPPSFPVLAVLNAIFQSLGKLASSLGCSAEIRSSGCLALPVAMGASAPEELD